MYSLTIFTTRVKLNCLSNWCISLLICPWFRYSDSKHNFWITRLWYNLGYSVNLWSFSSPYISPTQNVPSTDTWLVSHILQKLTMRQLVEFFSFLISIPIGPFTLLRWKSHESCACLLSLTHTLKRTTCFWTMSTFPYFQKLNSFASWIENNEYLGLKYKQLKHITKTFEILYFHEFAI